MSRKSEGDPTAIIASEKETLPRMKREKWRRTIGKYEGLVGLSLALIALEQKLDELENIKNLELLIPIENLIIECGSHLAGVNQISPRIAQEMSEYLSKARDYVEALTRKTK